MAKDQHVLDRIAAASERDRTEESRTCPHCRGRTEVKASEEGGMVHVRAICTGCGQPWSPDGGVS